MINPKPWQILPKIFWPMLFVSLLFGLAAWTYPLISPEPFTRHFLRNDAVLKTVHLAALGQLALLFLAVTTQALPVLFHLPNPKKDASLPGQILFILGVLALIAFFAGWRNYFSLSIALGSLSAGWALLYRRALVLSRESATRSFAWKGLSASFIYLGIMIALGSGMAIGLIRPLFPQTPLSTIQLHLHLGLWGFASLGLFGFMPKLLRLFQTSTGYADWPMKGSIYLVHLGLGLLFLDWLGLSTPWPARLAGLLLLAAAFLFVLQLALLLKSAKNRHFDSSLVTQLSGVFFLIIGAALDARLLWGLDDWRMQAACLCLGLGGWIGATLHGTTQRICAVLAWFERFLESSETHVVPTAWELIWPPLGWAVPALHVSGTGCLTAGLWIGNASLIRLGGGLGSLAILSTASLAFLSLRRGKVGPPLTSNPSSGQTISETSS